MFHRVAWALKYQGMVVLAASQTWWTWELEDVFQRLASNERTAMKSYADQQHKQLEEIVTRIRGDLTPNDRSKLTTLLIIDVHARDAADRFVRDSITEVNCTYTPPS